MNKKVARPSKKHLVAPKKNSGNSHADYIQKLYDQSEVNMAKFPAPEFLDRAIVRGYDLNQGVNYHKMFSQLAVTGFQATCLG